MRSSRFFAAIGAAALILGTTAACGGDDKSDDKGGGGEETASEVEVFTWWTSGSEALGLEALEGVLADKYPDIKFVNGGVTGGGGSAKDLLQTRLAAGQPPDTFQVHAGKEAQDYIDANQVEDVSDLYDKYGLNEVFPQDLVDMLTQDGKIYTIPSNVHRANVMWASIPVMEQAGLPTDTAYFKTIDEFITVLENMKTKLPDVTPLAVGGTWCQVHLLETVLIAELGADKYTGLFDGSTDWAGAEVKGALDKFGKLMSFTNADRDSMDWEPATQMVLDGKAAFNIMGDWVPALLDSNNLVAGKDYLYAPSPGTEGIYDFLADSFSRTVGAPHRAAADAWLDVISSTEGQIAFNKVKGSIPARTDIDLAEFSEYQQDAADSFKNDSIVGSIQHGAAATIQQGADANNAVSKFTTSPMAAGDLDTLQQELAAAFAG